MTNARPRSLVCALALTLLAAFTASGRGAVADGTAEAGVTISNRAEAFYTGADGAGYTTVSPTVSVIVLTVAAVTVTPDETDPSATVAPGERVVRPFRVCNTGNTPDFYTITSADVSAPAALVSLYFDTDASGTVTDSDRAITLGSTMSPRLARGQCVAVLAVVDTNGGQQGQQLSIRINTRSSVADAVNAGAQDAGTIVNAYGKGARLSSPDNPALPPVKLVEGKERVTTAPGQTLNYTVSFRNSGDIPARKVVMRDDLPDGLDYVAGTLRLNNRPLTDADDADEGLVVARRVEIHLAQVAVGETVEVAFQARAAASVAHGTGVVNSAAVAADNAPAASSTNATAVVNPFGVVYEGRSAGTPVAGARVSLLADSNSGSGVALDANTGSDPNNQNANPFAADAQGRWSFALAPAQLGSPQTPVRYFLNVTAAGFRARLIETTITPTSDGTGLFTLDVRSLDGQPVAKDGSFEVTDGAVEIQRLAAYALNIPVFENAALEITKSADRPSAEVGDTITYRVEVHNATAVAADDVTVSDQLPPSFHYAEGTALLLSPPDPTARSLNPEVSADGSLVFRLGRVLAGARAVVTYRVRVGANAVEGDQFNSASAAGTLATGERVTTPPARASVRVRSGLFSSQQVIVGRVYVDANLNGQFDSDERGLPGVRLYLNNGQSVITDSEGLYNFPVVNEGTQVVSLDPVTLPSGYSLVDTGRRDEKSWTRLLRTPLGGGALLRQNFALRSPDGETGAGVNNSGLKNGYASEASAKAGPARGPLSGSLFVGADATKNDLAAHGADGAGGGARTNGEGATKSEGATKNKTPLASGTYEMATDETLEPVAPGDVRVLSPQPDETVAGAALEISARTNAAWTVSVEVAGQRVPDSKIGEKRVDHKNDLATFNFVGLNVVPGPNRIRVTAVGPDGAVGKSVEVTAYGRGPAKRLEIVTDKAELSAGGRDSTTVRVRAFDQWNHPAADGSVALAVSSGHLLRVDDGSKDGSQQGRADDGSRDKAAGRGKAADRGDDKGLENPEEKNAPASQQIVPLVGGEGRALLVADNAPGASEIHAMTGAVEVKREIRVTPEVRPSILVGLAEVTFGSGQPALSGAESGAAVRSRLAFFYRGQFLGSNLLTLAYDSNRPINRTAGRDRLFQFDPLDRAYPLFGDSSTRYEDAQSNSKLYVRVDHKRSYFLFGDMETENRNAGLASYTRKLTGVKLHLEDSKGDYVSVTGARPDTAFARDTFPGDALGFAHLSHAEILPGSETVVIEVRDRRNPEAIISREALIRSVDYNLDASTGEMFFLRPISAFDFSFNLVQVVVTYEYQADGMSQAVYTARAYKNFEGLGLKVGLSLVDQQQGEFGAFVLGGLDAEKKLPRGGRVRLEWATSRGRVSSGGNLSGAGIDDRHDGNAYRVELEQPLPYRETMLRATYARADEGFLNPFGATVTPGSQRADASVEMKVTKSARAKFSFMDERNHTANVDNSRETASLLWTESFGDRLRATFGYDFRSFKDDLSGRQTDSNLVTVGAEYKATAKLSLSAKREQNLTDADPTYPNQTTLAATYQWNQFTKLFFTERLASAPIVPISDTAATGFAATTTRNETAVGVETKLGRFADLNSRYQIENGVNGTDSFAVIGLSNRLPINKELSLDLGYERGFHLAGNGASFNAAHLGFSWQPIENFRTTARYEMRDRDGMGTVLTLGAAGRLFDNVTSLGRFQLSRTNFQGRDSSALSATAALAWRPLHTDAVGLLFSYTRRDISQRGAGTEGATRDRSDTLSADGYYQATRNLELYGRFALKFGDTASPGLARVSTLTYLMQGRGVYRFGKYIDFAGEGRWLAQPATATARASFGTELGFWVLSDLRLGGGYNWTGVTEPGASPLLAARRGFYFTISSKLSNLFNLFGTPRQNAQSQGSGAQDGDTSAGRPKHEDE
ncbi:MAG: hypothetical protein DMF67_07065 [Acidobacteria bacterium]|nr:MAG: hypothetical protein DMF67_07065 [Acidobacteriota bacterium]